MYKTYSALQAHLVDGVLTLTMDNPPMNAMRRDIHDELTRIFPDISRDPDVKVVVLTGAGSKAFSAGGDIKGMATRRETLDVQSWMAAADGARRILYGMLHCEKPVIGRINGHAMGLGATLAAYCDITVMMADAKIADTHVKVGLSAGDGGAAIWPLLMGFTRARRYLLTGDPLTGREAAEAGLVTEAVDTVEELDARVAYYVNGIATGAAAAVAETKRGINLVLRRILDGVFEEHLGGETRTFFSEDHLEAAQAFRDKRNPVFKGR